MTHQPVLTGRNASPYTRRVAIVLRLLDLPFKQVPLSPFSDLEAIRDVNPLGRVPALTVEDGVTLVESAAIIDHLLESHDPEGRILSRSGTARRDDLQLTALCQTACDKGVLAGHELLLRPEQKRHLPYLYERVDQSRTAMVAIENRLGNRARKTGKPTLGEVTVAVTYGFLNGFVPGILQGQNLPMVAALSADLEDTDAFRHHEPEARMNLSLPKTDALQ